ncbi:AAA family ATPase [Sporosarcina sp. FSL K6-6792]|uniref:AAA family ATPase n=1 Tax=Sporosarcina sp. FSL K6-6792 TaxID=2921559 RepID=UPI0030FD03E1
MLGRNLGVTELNNLSLESEINAFLNSLPYCVKFLSRKLIIGEMPTDEEVMVAYNYFLEDLGLKVKSKREEILFEIPDIDEGKYNSHLYLDELKNVKGVNALVENQTIKFNPNITVIYGANGSGKTGYIRMLKKAFFNRANEEILPDVYNDKSEQESLSADFTFKTDNNSYSLNIPGNHAAPEFSRFAIFDNNSATVHLNSKNEFEFRPASLNIFSRLTLAFKKIEEKISLEITSKSIEKDFSALFDGDSEIKTLIQNLDVKTQLTNLDRYTPYSESDKQEKKRLEEKKIDLLTLKKDEEVKVLNETKELIGKLEKSIENLNEYFTTESITKVYSTIETLIENEDKSKKEEIQNFKFERITNTDGEEWKVFIEAAADFSKKQPSVNYPEQGDSCLLCQQTLSNDAVKLISSYWDVIKSQTEKEVKQTKEKMSHLKSFYGKLDFNLLRDNDILTKWLIEKFPETAQKMREDLRTQQELLNMLIIDIEQKVPFVRQSFQIDKTLLNAIDLYIDSNIIEIELKEPNEEIALINKQIIYLTHKEKLNEHIPKIKEYIQDLQWLKIATEAKKQLSTRKVTIKEKELSEKYFNQSYIDKFNEECWKLDGEFGVEINHSSNIGTSYRELKIKENMPSKVLSEGEQKVIAIADFLSEIQLSEINRGIVFDDPVTSLDEGRKSVIANRLVKEAKNRQVVIFTHDLVFVSSILRECEESDTLFDCHWIEKIEGSPGTIWLKNTPSYEKDYKKSGKAQKYYEEALKLGPENRENNIKNGFASLRTSYEALVVFDLFAGVVQRFTERISLDSLKGVYFDKVIIKEIVDSYGQCCRYMEGHSHSDKYAYKKPTLENFKEEIDRFNEVKKKLKDLKKEAIKT